MSGRRFGRYRDSISQVRDNPCVVVSVNGEELTDQPHPQMAG
jgi:hypothetical protein